MLKGFELGADDYVTKPFPISVFQKKVSALLNRISAQSGGDFYDDGNLYINFSELSACLAGQPITLTSLEYRNGNRSRIGFGGAAFGNRWNIVY